MDLEYLESIRRYELDEALPGIQRGSMLLEIGAGTGWQAKALSGKGYSVRAIDLAQSNYRNSRVWPIEEYDGLNIPFPDQFFDVVFSSSVLEHIPDLEGFQKEIQRVLKPGGAAIHIVPTTCWRLLTSVAYYPYLLKRLASAITGGAATAKPAEATPDRLSDNRELLLDAARRLFPERHGERGNFLSEQYYFSRFYWLKLFRNSGWTISGFRTNRMLYSGYAVLGPRLGLKKRQYLSRIFGSSCFIFVLRLQGS